MRAYAIVDAEDAGLVNQRRWQLSSGGYVERCVVGGTPRKKRTLSLHRFLLGLGFGDPREGDHRDRDPLNNRRGNLRIVAHAHNGQNHPGHGGTSRHRGVSWDGDSGRWRAQAQLDGRKHNLGRYATEEDADAGARAFRRAHMPYSQDNPEAP